MLPFVSTLDPDACKLQVPPVSERARRRHVHDKETRSPGVFTVDILVTRLASAVLASSLRLVANGLVASLAMLIRVRANLINLTDHLS